MITSFRDGRVRVRSQKLKSFEALSSILGMLKEVEGIIHTQGNYRTGSLLVEYDPARITQDHLKLAVESLDLMDTCPQPLKRTRLISRKAENRLLIGSCMLCIMGAFYNKSVHTAGGVLFMALTLRHAYTHRKSFM